jgi:hypothetical protein
MIAHALKATATWSTWSFVSHYYFGKGVAVNLVDIGLATQFENAVSVKRTTEAFIRTVMSRAHPGYTYAKVGFSDVKGEPGLFSIGRSQVFRNASCGTGSCDFHFSIRDSFKDPLDIRGVEPGGTPYDIHHDWSDRRMY